MQPYAPLAGPQPKLKGKAGLWIGALLIALGIIGGIAIAVISALGITRTIDDLQRVPINGGGTIHADHPGTYRLFLERPGIDNEGAFAFSPGVRVIGPDGELPIVGERVNKTYSYSGHDGRSIGHFNAPRAGDYRITTTVTGGTLDRSEIAVTAGDPIAGLVGVLVGVFGGIALVVVGAIVMIVSGVRRSRSRRELLGATGVPLSGWAVPPPPGTSGPYGAPYGVPYGAGPPPPPGAPGWAPPPQAPGWAPPPPPPSAPGSPSGPPGGPPPGPYGPES